MDKRFGNLQPDAQKTLTEDMLAEVMNYGFYSLQPDSPRNITGDILAEIAKTNDKIVVVNADMGKNADFDDFMAVYPERTFDVGIAEQNLISFAAGLAHEGYIPYVSTFAVFLSTRACEQVRTDVCYGKVPVRIISFNCGYSGGMMGATHSGLEDVAIFGSFGGMVIMEAADTVMYTKMLKQTAELDAPIYIRHGDIVLDTPLYGEDDEFVVGKAMIPREGNDGAFIASGIVVRFALEAAARIEQETGKKIRVVDMQTIKPVDRDAVREAAATGRVIVAQDHTIMGGLGHYVAVAIAEEGIGCKFKILGAPDKYVPLATINYLYKINEYDADGLYKNMMAMLDEEA